MTMPTDVVLPEVLVEAAARALHEHDRLEFTGEPPWEGLQEEERESYRDGLRAAFAAALGECDVREEWSATDGQGRSYWSGSREGLVNWATYPGRSEVTYSRRLSIRTPAEPDPSAGAP